MKITKGQKYLCVHEMQHMFTKGKIYPTIDFNEFLNDLGNKHIFCSDGIGAFLQPIDKAKWAVKRTPENADELDKWSGQKWNGEIDISVTSTKTWCNRLPTDHTEISFDTFKEIVGIEEEIQQTVTELLPEEEKRLEVGDWVIGWHAKYQKYKDTAWQITNVSKGFISPDNNISVTGVGDVRLATKKEIEAAEQPTEEWQPKWGEEVEGRYEYGIKFVKTVKGKYLSKSNFKDHHLIETEEGDFIGIYPCTNLKKSMSEIPMSEALEIIAQAKGINKEQIKIV